MNFLLVQFSKFSIGSVFPITHLRFCFNIYAWLCLKHLCMDIYVWLPFCTSEKSPVYPTSHLCVVLHFLILIKLFRGHKSFLWGNWAIPAMLHAKVNPQFALFILLLCWGDGVGEQRGHAFPMPCEIMSRRWLLLVAIQISCFLTYRVSSLMRRIILSFS